MESYDKGTMRRHTFNDNSFLWYSGSLLGVSLVIITILVVTAAMLVSQLGLKLRLPGFILPAVMIACLVFIFISQCFVMKHSEVLTAPGLVVYRKRKLFAGPERVFYIVYTIKSVEALYGGTKSLKSDFGVYGSIFVTGDIEVSYVYEDGKESDSQKSCTRVMIHSCFTAMSAVYSTLENMR